MKRNLLVIILILLSCQSRAQLVYSAAFLSKNPTVSSYRLFLFITKPHSEFGTTVASEGDVFYCNGNTKPGEPTVDLGTKANCPAFTRNGITFNTGKDALGCLKDYMNDDATTEAAQAAIDYALGHLADFKGPKTPQVEGFMMYPIPAHNYLNIVSHFKDVRGHADLVIADMAGKTVFRYDIQNPGKDAFTLCLKDFKPGSYVLTITEGRDRELTRQTIIVN